MSFVPNKDWEYKIADLENSGSTDFTVDGSVENVTFKWSPGDGEVWTIESITLFLLDPGTMTDSVFGALGSALTNGLTMKIKRDSTDNLVRVMKDNSCVLMSFGHDVIVGNSATGFLESNDYFKGSFIPKSEMRLVGDTSDNVKIIVKDDLTGIQRLRATAIVKRPI